MKILIVDDDDIALSIAKKILESENYDVEIALDVESALDLLRKSDIHMVISDWNMPEVTGLDLCRILRTSAPTVGYIYIILVTARNSKEDMLAGLSAGADDFISKPYQPAELLVRVRNAQRVLDLQTATTMLFSLARLAESKDVETGNHLERIRDYARVLAKHICQNPQIQKMLPLNFPDLLYQTSPLHDIGKVGIPDSVLLKPGELNDNEWKIMKRHAEIGAETLDKSLQFNPIASYLFIARDIAWAHHERWDGQGYPRGLKGEEIPMAARIVALADVYDAITSKRVYKSAEPHEVAKGIIVNDSGTHFDPTVVKAFLEIEDSFRQISLSHLN